MRNRKSEETGGSKSRLAKAAGAEPFGQVRDEKCKIGAKHMSKSQKSKKLAGSGCLDVQIYCSSVAWQAQGIVRLAKVGKMWGSATTTTTLHSIPFHFTRLHCTSLHFITTTSYNYKLQLQATSYNLQATTIYTTLHSLQLQPHYTHYNYNYN